MKKQLKALYNLIPFKKQIFLFFKLFISPKKNIYQHLNFKGLFRVKVSKDRNFKLKHYGFEVENEIFWNGLFGGWEKVSLSIWAELCETSHNIFDVGANTGTYSMLAKSINPDANVYAFEPVKRVYEKLVTNNNINSFNIDCNSKAVSNFDGEATIYDRDTEHIYSVTVNYDRNVDKELSIPVKVKTVRLDTFIKKKLITNIDLLKVDVELHEAEVLEGLGKYLKLYEPTFLIEILNNEVARNIEKIIIGINYEFYVIDESSGIKQVDHLRKSDCYNFLICKPEVSKRLETLKRFTKSYN